jgi:hypothetical protein
LSEKLIFYSYQSSLSVSPQLILFLSFYANMSQLMFTWMAIDRTNVSGVLTSTFLSDTNMTRDQANTGVSLLWLGIVLLEIPSNVYPPSFYLPNSPFPI